MLRRLKRYFWWLVGVVCLWTAIWFFYKGSEIDKQWDEQMGQTEGNWKEIDKQLLELLTAHKQAESNREKSRLEGELINLQTKHFTLQREALKKTQGLWSSPRKMDTELRMFWVMRALELDGGQIPQ